MTIFKWGSYSHPANEINLVNIDVRNHHSGRGQLHNVLFTYYLRGEICDDSTADITSRIAEIESAYSVEGQDCGLYIDASTPTQHVLTNNHPNNLSGNRIIQRPSFPEGGPTEYATGRTYSIIIQALFASPESQVIEYQESVEFYGDCGADVEVWHPIRGAPRLYQRSERTAQRIVQRGHSVGFNGYAEPFGPLYPQYEHRNKRYWKRGSPIFRGRQFTNWPMEWAFVMTAPTAQDSPPNFQ